MLRAIQEDGGVRLDMAHTQIRAPAASLPTAAATARPRVLVLGIGNTLLGDDGVGVRLLACLQADDSLPEAIYVDGGTLSFSLLGHLEQVDAMLVVDAAELGAAPGTIATFEDEAMDRLLAASRGRSVHEVGLSDLMDMARLQDCLPPRRALVSIQPARVDWSESLSAPVAAALAAACRTAAEILTRWDSES